MLDIDGATPDSPTATPTPDSQNLLEAGKSTEIIVSESADAQNADEESGANLLDATADVRPKAHKTTEAQNENFGLSVPDIVVEREDGEESDTCHSIPDMQERAEDLEDFVEQTADTATLQSVIQVEDQQKDMDNFAGNSAADVNPFDSEEIRKEESKTEAEVHGDELIQSPDAYQQSETINSLPLENESLVPDVIDHSPLETRMQDENIQQEPVVLVHAEPSMSLEPTLAAEPTSSVEPASLEEPTALVEPTLSVEPAIQVDNVRTTQSEPMDLESELRLAAELENKMAEDDQVEQSANNTLDQWEPEVITKEAMKDLESQRPADDLAEEMDRVRMDEEDKDLVDDQSNEVDLPEPEVPAVAVERRSLGKISIISFSGYGKLSKRGRNTYAYMI